MNIGQFFRIIWAYKVFILVVTLTCFVSGVAVVNLVTPRYEAQTRAMLDIIKPDPVTGEVISSAFQRAYTKTQTEMIKGQQVARMVVRDLGWEKDPARLAAYRSRRGDQELDFIAWAAQKVMDGTTANVIMGSNILEISYASKSPEEARRVADGLLKAYMDMTLQSRRENARRNAEWYEAQAEKTKGVLFAAEAAKSQYEREYGIILQDNKMDLDSARLQALAGQGAAPIIASPGGLTSPSGSQLAALDAEIAEQTKVLGPNHPLLLQLKSRRTLLANQVAEERSLASNSAGVAMNAARATGGVLEAQKAKVLAQREKVERLRLMQDEIDLRRDQYSKAVARAAQLRQEADVAEAGVTPLAHAITPQSPVFPNKTLFIGASLPGGAGLGVFIALLLEMFGRRIRSADDLRSAVNAPVLAVIHNPIAKKKPLPKIVQLPRVFGKKAPQRVARA